MSISSSDYYALNAQSKNHHCTPCNDTETNWLLLRCRLYRIVELCQKPDSAACSHRLLMASIYQYLNNNRDQNNIRHVSIIRNISKYPLSQSTKERKTFPVDNFCVHGGLLYQLHGRRIEITLESANIVKLWNETSFWASEAGLSCLLTTIVIKITSDMSQSSVPSQNNLSLNQ